MDIKELKKSIEDKTIKVDFMIFKYEDIDFLVSQYIEEISNILGLETWYLDDSNNIINIKTNLFEEENITTYLRVLYIDIFDLTNKKIQDEHNLIIICKKISKEAEDLFYDNIIRFPKLEPWQIKDYVYSIASGIDEKKLDTLISICNNDIYRINNELDKIKIFNVNERKYVFDDFIENGIFNDLTEHNIFDFSNALLKRDIVTLSNLYKEIQKIDCEPLGLVTLLYNNIKTIMSIQLLPNCTPESLNMPANRFWAIKKNNCGFYNRDQLLSIFYLITDIDKKLKTGEITVDIIIDYIVCHVMSF